MVQKVLIKRTSTNDAPPAGLLPGELSVEMGLPTRLWVGVPTINDPGLKKLLFDSSQAKIPITRSLVRPFTTSVLYTPTLGMRFAIVEAVGGGGGGGGTIGTVGWYFGGGGGSAGSYSRSLLTAIQIGASQPITIGAGGTGGVGGAGTVGGNTSFGTLVTANGGSFGFNSDGSAGAGGSVGGGGATTTPGTGDLACGGAPGGNGMYAVNSAVGTSGEGGSSIFGAGGHGVYFQGVAQVGINGLGYGSGGSGGHTPNTAAWSTGGNGSNGIVVVTEFF